MREGARETIDLPGGPAPQLVAIPTPLVPSDEGFESLWSLRPEHFARIRMGGRMVDAPRWYRAYGRDYVFTGQTSEAHELPETMAPFLRWAREHIDRRLDGLLVNWYDAALGHFIGPHRDRFGALVPGAPIVTISLGEARLFRFDEIGGPGRVDVELRSGSALVIPSETNRRWKHSLPRRARYRGRRISITMRAFR